jgi:hypothetical protein
MRSRDEVFHDYVRRNVPDTHLRRTTDHKIYCHVTGAFNAKYSPDDIPDVLDRWRLSDAIGAGRPDGIVVVDADGLRTVYTDDPEYQKIVDAK